MKCIAYVFLAEIALTGMLVGVSGAQSEPLGDYARSIRKEDKAPASAKKYDNDNLPTSDNISVVGNATDTAGPEDANPAPDATPPSRKTALPLPHRQRRMRPRRRTRTTPGSRRLPISRARLTCSRVNWT